MKTRQKELAHKDGVERYVVEMLTTNSAGVGFDFTLQGKRKKIKRTKPPRELPAKDQQVIPAALTFTSRVFGKECSFLAVSTPLIS